MIISAITLASKYPSYNTGVTVAIPGQSWDGHRSHNLCVSLLKITRVVTMTIF